MLMARSMAVLRNSRDLVMGRNSDFAPLCSLMEDSRELGSTEHMYNLFVVIVVHEEYLICADSNMVNRRTDVQLWVDLAVDAIGQSDTVGKAPPSSSVSSSSFFQTPAILSNSINNKSPLSIETALSSIYHNAQEVCTAVLELQAASIDCSAFMLTDMWL